MNKILLITCLFVLNTLNVLSQSSSLSIRKDSAKFQEVILELEAKTNKRFFYKEEWVQSTILDIDIKQKSIVEVLDVLSKKAKLNYCFIDDNTIAFTNDYRIKVNFGNEYRQYLSREHVFKADTIEYAPPPSQEIEKKIVNQEYQTYNIGSPSIDRHLKSATLSGIVKDIKSGEPLVGTIIYVDELSKGSVTNSYGRYTITIPKGQYRIEYRSMGMRTTHRNVNLFSDGALNVELKNSTTAINEVTVTAEADNKVKNLRMGMEKISLESLKRLPSGFGEADIIKGTLYLPGVQAVSEASAGFNVRGGSTDQNLILLADAPIINTSHFFGFFSGFNADLVKDVTLLKSSIPAKYGGRASSVMDIKLKEGNKQHMKISGGISPVSGRLTVEAPLKKDKSSFIVGMRSTYSNWVLKLLDDVKLKNSSANFQDIQSNLSFDLNKKNKLNISTYYSHDDFDYYTENAYAYNTLASSVKWHRTFSPRLFSSFSGIMSHYDYSMKSQEDPSSPSEIIYALKQYALKSDFTYQTSGSHKLDFGIHSTLYNLSPGEEHTPSGKVTIEKERALETSLYLSDEFDLTHFMSVSGGLRYTVYGNFGAKSQLNYAPGYPRHEDNILDTTHYSSGEILQLYANPEFRFASNFTINNTTSIKLGVSRMFQYIQMISNTAAMSPTDIWKLSDKYIKPLRSDQYSIGFYKNFNKKYEFSAEFYYKKLKNIIDYKGGAQLVMNHHLETDVLNGNGKAYGAEFMIEKKKGKLTGWVNYTYSRVFHKITTPFIQEEVNNGDYFPANYDKPHDLNITTNYKAGRRVNLSASYFYSSGRPFTAPIAYFKFKGSLRPYYSERNELRIENYKRLDIAATLHGNLIKNKLNHSSWTFAIQNVLGRKNPYSVYFKTEGKDVNGYKMSIYGQPIFTVTYNFKFMGNAQDDF